MLIDAPSYEEEEKEEEGKSGGRSSVKEIDLDEENFDEVVRKLMAQNKL
ncbi:hypothetical protein [Spirosoma arboris]|nr:hypothetical protein [Spirosoma arboris]